jgi:tRNA (guanine6-N2)-methyltransferase
VLARQVGRTAYRRAEAQRAVELGIAARGDYHWRPAEEGALEFWLTLLPGEALLALRLSDASTRHRDYKVAHLPASLRPSAAAALVWLTRPAPEDVFLDPMCGAGTLLIERAHAGRYAMLLGGDLRPEALAAARTNIGPRYQPIELRQWDARHLPLDAASVTAAAVNLPFGKQIGASPENRTLYPAALRELARVLRPHARLVALTGDTQAFDEALRHTPRLARREQYSVQVLGQPARVYVLERS